MKIAILDDYQNVALRLADWSAVRRAAQTVVLNDPVVGPSAVIERLRPFDVVCVMRERTPLPREILQQLPNLKLIASTGPRNASIDSQAATDLGIAITATGYDFYPDHRVHLVADPGEYAGHRPGGGVAQGGRLADRARLEPARQDARGRRVGKRRKRNRANRSCLWHEGDRLEPELDRGDGQCRRRHPRRQADAISRGGRRYGAPRPERTHQRPDRAVRVHLDEADGKAHQHVAWSDSGRSGSDRSAAGAPDCRRGGRRIRRGATASGSSVPEAAEPPGDPSHRLRDRRSLSGLLRRRRGQHRQVAQGQRGGRIINFTRDANEV